MKNILLPTDFSENSKNAIKYALDFFKDETCTFHILNTHKPSGYITADVLHSKPGSSVYESVLRDNKEQLATMVTFCESYSKNENHTFIPKIDFDDIVSAVKQIINKENIDLIIMGTKGATGAANIIFGSNTIKIIRNVQCALLVVPQDFKFEGVNNVLLSLHQQNDITKKSFQLFLNLVQLQQASIKLLNISENDTVDTLQQSYLTSIFKEVEVAQYTLKNISVPLAVSAFTQLIPVELHATIARHKSFIDRLVYGSNTSEINHNSRVPLLVLHE
ncbi:MAG: hypothetical protein CL526_06955 [Aequorivita sp.]|nr:hypothetical protein [Aequorivita sp.]|tara:strand:+ start:115221 stop:116048 length:828 start_codon:yes stop_codon:yes gene_type:complete